MFRSSPLFFYIAVMFALTVGLPQGLQAATPVQISVTDGGFAPQVAMVPINTTVTWTCEGGVHNTTSRDGLWNSGVLTQGQSFSYNFPATGLYYYYDNIHQWPSGVVQVVYSQAEIEVSSDKALYASGDPISIGLRISNPGDPVQAGVYVWLSTPDGGLVWLLQLPSLSLPAGFTYDNDHWMSAVLPPLLRGEYVLNATIVKEPEQVAVSSSSASWTFGRVDQTDWSGGPSKTHPSPLWGQGFDSSTGVSFMSVPGQLALSAHPKGTAVDSVIFSDAGRPNSVATGDLNGDGSDDVISTDPVYDVWNKLGAIYWWEQPKGGVWDKHVVSNDYYGAHYVKAADVDLDGDADVIAAAYYGDGPELGRNGKFAWFENLDGLGGSWQKHVVGDLFWGGDYMDAGDLDGDGDVDLIGASEITYGVNAQESDITWFENLDGLGDTWGQHDLDLDFPNASAVHMTDLDGDGDLDVVGANSAETGASHFAWWENLNGDGSAWTKRIIPYSFWGSGYVSVGDIDNDGDIDLMGGGYNTSAVGFWENLDGKGTSWVAYTITDLSNGWGVDLKDLDGDGDLDGLVWNTQRVEWLENADGQGNAWTVHLFNSIVSLPWAAAGDVDHDGKLEIAVSSEEFASPQGAQLLLFDAYDFDSEGQLTSSILDGGPNPGWSVMTWTEKVFVGASVVIEVRASNEPANMGSYVTVPSSGFDVGSLVDPNAQYLQYRIKLSGTSPDYSPTLLDLGIARGKGF